MCKRVICLAFLCALGLAPVADAGLVGWWKLDETTGTTVSDSSGNGITGNFVGTPKWVAGKLDGALQFDGTTAAVDFGNPPKAILTERLSIACWVNPAVNTGERAILARAASYVFKGHGATVRFTTPGVRDHDGLNTPFKAGEWQHLAVAFQASQTGGCAFFVNGVETDRVNASAFAAAAATGTGPVLMGNNQWNERFSGLLDDVRLYDRVLTPEQAKDLYEGKPPTWPKSEKPNPADKAIGVSQALFQWTPGENAAFHNVYVGTTPELTQANLGGPNLPFAMYFHVAGLQPGVVHYWRVDEVDAAGKVATGDVWSFTATPATAWAQKPPEGSTYAATTTTLEWTAGINAVTHEVYLSTDRAAVEAGAPGAKKADKLSLTSYAATDLERGKTYHWRVDEIVADGSKVAGPIWSFSVRPVIAKADPSLVGWWKLDDEKSLFMVDSSGYDNYGTPQGGVGFVSGYLGDALSFDGTDDWVDCGTDASLANVESVSVAAWIRRGALGSERRIVSNHNNTNGGYKLTVYSNNKVEFEIRTSANAATRNRTAPSGLVLDQGVWYHVVGVYEKGKAIRTYVNGKLDREFATTDVAGVSNGVFRIGRESYTNGNRWLGLLDDVRVYNKALTETEIQQVMRGDVSVAWQPQPKPNAVLDMRDATELKWSAGDNAAKHDVYLGKDKDAVRTADTTSPLYQGRQTGASFALAGKVEFGGGAYFWRIDEVEADGTMIHKGIVWSFTIPGYLIVDEFENYTDKVGGEIFTAWIDGYADGYKSSGSTVGYTTAANGTFSETVVIHSGKQSMPMDYNNLKTPFFSEAVQEFAPLQDWTGYGVTDLSFWFRGRLATALLVEAPPGQYKIGAASNDIEGTADSFRFFYKTLSGDGSITAKVIATTGTTTNWAKVGVMIRESLDPSSTYGFMFPTPDRRRAFQNRPTTGSAVVSAHSATGAFAAFPFWVRVERKGSQITGYYSTDGKTWTRQPDTENTGTNRSLNPVTINMTNDVVIGLAVASNNFGAATCFGEFSDVTTTGSVRGDWKLVPVGATYSNDPDKLYVVVEDSAGKNAVMTYSDPAATVLTTWTEWKIPLSSLTGVNLAKVKKVYVGVGDRKATAPTGKGRMYLDDIRVIKQ